MMLPFVLWLLFTNLALMWVGGYLFLDGIDGGSDRGVYKVLGGQALFIYALVGFYAFHLLVKALHP